MFRGGTEPKTFHDELHVYALHELSWHPDFLMVSWPMELEAMGSAFSRDKHEHASVVQALAESTVFKTSTVS